MPKLKNKSTKNKSTKNKPTKNNVNKKEHSPLISKKTIDLLQYRIQEEEMSVRIYLSMAMWLENEGYVNASKLWKKYSAEENTHADWAREYLLSFGVLPDTPELKKVNIFDGVMALSSFSLTADIVTSSSSGTMV